MSKILMKKSDLTRLVENLLIDKSLLIEGIVPGTSFEDDLIDDSLLDADTDEWEDEEDPEGETDDDSIDAEAEDSEDYMTQVKRVAGKIVDKVSSGASKAYDAAKDIGGVALEKGKKLGSSAWKKSVELKDDIKKLSGEDGFVSAAIGVGESLYDLGDTALEVGGQAGRSIAALGQGVANINRDVVTLMADSEDALETHDIFFKQPLAGASDTDMSFFASTKLADVAATPDIDMSFFHFFPTLQQALKRSFFALDRNGDVPKLENYGNDAYKELASQPADYFETMIINSINSDMTSLITTTNEFHQKVDEDNPNIDEFLTHLGELFTIDSPEGKATLTSIGAAIKEAGTKNLEPYVNQVYSAIVTLLINDRSGIGELIDAINRSMKAGRKRIKKFQRDGHYLSKDKFPSLYHELDEEKIVKNLDKVIEDYTDLAGSSRASKAFAGTWDATKELGSAINRPLTRLTGDIHPNPSKFEKSKKK